MSAQRKALIVASDQYEQEGPPIARACTLRPSHDWIRCALTAEGFDVSADTSRTGRFEGTIEVKGPHRPRHGHRGARRRGTRRRARSRPGPAPEVAPTPAPAPDPEAGPEPEPLVSSAALGCGIAVLRRARDALTVTGLVMTVLMTAGAALIAISAFRSPSFLSVPGCLILLAAAVSSLVMAAILLRRLLRPRVSAGR